MPTAIHAEWLMQAVGDTVWHGRWVLRNRDCGQARLMCFHCRSLGRHGEALELNRPSPSGLLSDCISAGAMLDIAVAGLVLTLDNCVAR